MTLLQNAEVYHGVHRKHGVQKEKNFRAFSPELSALSPSYLSDLRVLRGSISAFCSRVIRLHGFTLLFCLCVPLYAFMDQRSGIPKPILPGIP